MKRTAIALIILAFMLAPFAGCTSESFDPNALPVAITYGKVQSTFLKFGIDINGDYCKALKAHGARSVRLFIADAPADVDAKLAGVAGVLVPGGFDIEPARFKEERVKECEASDLALDELEYKVLEFARAKKLPVLGICRGMQMLTVFYGGSLYQDIPAYFKSASPIPHRESLDLWIYKHARPCFHDAVLEKGGMLAALLGAEKIKVNTYHHQGAKAVAPGTRVIARAADGFVEGIEGTGDQWILGTQFHPEMLRLEDTRFDAIFARFVQEVGKRQGAKAARQ